MSLPRPLLNGVRAGILATALGVGGLAAAAPVQAATPTFGFSLNFGGPHMGPGFFFRFGDPNYFKYCMTDRQIVRELRAHGYHYVQLLNPDNRHNKVWAVGKKNGNWYQLRVDRCTGKVDRIRLIHGPDRKGHFSLTFTF